MPVETAVYVPDILKILGWSRPKLYRRIEELKDAGVIMERLEGSPPRKRLCAFPSVVQRWMVLQAVDRKVL